MPNRQAEAPPCAHRPSWHFRLSSPCSLASLFSPIFPEPPRHLQRQYHLHAIQSQTSSPPSSTTIEYPGGIEVTGGAGGWDLTCVGVLTAPETMQVEAVSQVVTTILTASGTAVAPLLEAARQTADAINQGARLPKHDPATGLDPGSAGAIRQLIANNGVRQADVSSLPAAPVLTAHLTGPGFKITPQTPNPQPVGLGATSLGATTTWSWATEAVDPGSQILTVSYEAEVKVAGQKIPKSFRTITRTITVSVAPRDFIKRLADDSSSAKTIAENVSWIWTTMIFPGGMFVYGAEVVARAERLASILLVGGSAVMTERRS